MYGDTNQGGDASTLHFVTCDLFSYTDCSCMSTAESDFSGSSKKRKTPQAHTFLIDQESVTALSAKRLILGRPSLIDRLILKNKSALQEMEGKRRGPGRPPLSEKNKLDSKISVKRKFPSSINDVSPAIKRLRSAKEGSESDSSESRNTSIERRRGRPPLDKSIPKKSPRKMERRVSMRISTTLRSGKKRKDLLALKQKQLKSTDARLKKNVPDKTDTNSNVFNGENDSNEEGDSSDSEVSRAVSEASDQILNTTQKLDTDKLKTPQDEETKRRRKRRKRDSMWVRKVKKQIRAKVSIDTKPSLNPENKISVVDTTLDCSENVMETSDIPILDKESDDSLNSDNIKIIEPVLNNIVNEDIAMPKLEKEVDLPTEEITDSPSQNQLIKVETSLNDSLLLDNIPSNVSIECTNENESKYSLDENIEQSIINSNINKNISTKEIIQNNSLNENLSSVDNLKIESLNENLSSAETKKIESLDANLISRESINEIEILNSDLPPEISGTIVPERVLETINIERIEINSSYSENGKDGSQKANVSEDKSLSNGVPVDEPMDVDENLIIPVKEEINLKQPRIESSNVDNINKKIVNDWVLDVSKTESILTIDEQTENSILNSSNESFDIGESSKEAKTVSSNILKSDESFNDFSLSFPDDLDMDTSVSDDQDDETLEEEVQPPNILSDSIEQINLGIPENEHNDKKNFEAECYRIDSTKFDHMVLNTAECSKQLDEAEIGDSKESTGKKEDCQSMEQDEAVIRKDDKVPSIDCELIGPKTADEMLRDILGKEINEEAKSEELTYEQRQMKESVLQALGLKSLAPTQPEDKPKRDGYTGTLKAVIKLNRNGDHKKMVYRRSEDNLGELEYRICSEIPATDGVPFTHLNDIAGVRKNVSKLHQDRDASTSNGSLSSSNGSYEDNENQDEAKGNNGKESNLVIPEKSSSFSIHPTRLCSDVCTYCFGKFGSLDTPCHVAHLKLERQKKVLENELHLTAESCLCDACYRFVDRKANYYKGTKSETKPRVRPPTSSRCCVNQCTQPATHTVKKKWLVKLKKSISKIQNDKLDIDIDKPSSTNMYFPLCTQHHYWVEHFTVCGICRKRLNRNHLFSLGTETDRLNLMLAEDGIPARLSDKLFLCKLCRYYSNLRLKYTDPESIPPSSLIFYKDYRRKILLSLGITISDSEEEQIKEQKKKSSKKQSGEGCSGNNGSGPSSNNSEENVMSLSNLATLLGDQPEQQARIQVKFGNVNIGRLSNLNIGQGGREERTPHSDVGLQANLEFESSTDGHWERCVSTIQFDKRTKNLWHELQKPYGNQSSFIRHLIMLEKYWRAGYLAFVPGSDERAIKYLSGVKNRIKAFEGSSDKATPSTSASLSVPDKLPQPSSHRAEVDIIPTKVLPKKVTPLSLSDKKLMTPLDRAKSLVRMVRPGPQYTVPVHRYPVPMYAPYSYQQHPQNHVQPRPPPLLKIRNNLHSTSSNDGTQHYYCMPMPIGNSTPNLKPILPKLPRALTVTQIPQGGAAITLNRSGITIEKQSGGSPVMPALPIEKPSISVFREPAPGPP